MVKNLAANTGDMGLIPGWGKFHMLQEQLSPCATTTEARRPASLLSATREVAAMRSPCTATKSRHHPLQIKKAHAQQQRLSGAKNILTKKRKRRAVKLGTHYPVTWELHIQ